MLCNNIIPADSEDFSVLVTLNLNVRYTEIIFVNLRCVKQNCACLLTPVLVVSG